MAALPNGGLAIAHRLRWCSMGRRGTNMSSVVPLIRTFSSVLEPPPMCPPSVLNFLTPPPKQKHLSSVVGTLLYSIALPI
mmetsp:Transcript_28900/g.88628  ORF Transcript_28900/g.88628 Transcript_28900/m.88628 type:complete len:80 (+) Transcript_28900:2828-3067(+)